MNTYIYVEYEFINDRRAIINADKKQEVHKNIQTSIVHTFWYQNDSNMSFICPRNKQNNYETVIGPFLWCSDGLKEFISMSVKGSV